MAYRSVVTVQSALGLLLLTVIATAQQKPEGLSEQASKERSRQIFKALNCEEHDPAALKAFAGCWEIGQVSRPPTRDHLKLGLRVAPRRIQMWLDSVSAHHEWDSSEPRYCSVNGQFILTPKLNIDFKREDTYAYQMQIITPDDVEKLIPITLPDGEEDNRDLIEQRRRALLEFVKRGGRYIRTVLILSPENMWWDDDGEEDFWALPASCDDWPKVEEKLKAVKR